MKTARFQISSVMAAAIGTLMSRWRTRHQPNMAESLSRKGPQNFTQYIGERPEWILNNETLCTAKTMKGNNTYEKR